MRKAAVAYCSGPGGGVTCNEPPDDEANAAQEALAKDIG